MPTPPIPSSKRTPEVVVISDVHLGTYGSRAKELHQYLKSIQPKILILNGDIIDIWQFSKSYFPKAHLKVVKKLVSMISKTTKVIYITGNHDDTLRRFVDLQAGEFELCNKKVLELDGKKAWFFHGDVFDGSVQHSKWIAKLGGYGYDFLILINSMTNWLLEQMGREKYSFSKRIKASVKNAVKFIGDFEQTAIELAADNRFDYVACGHIHQPCIRTVNHKGQIVTYLNSGDWIENLTALEYYDKTWHLYTYRASDFDPEDDSTDGVESMSNAHLLKDVTSIFLNSPS